jgi:hypothetical protein
MVDLKSFKQLALSFTGVTEQPHFEKTSFRTKKRILQRFLWNTNGPV